MSALLITPVDAFSAIPSGSGGWLALLLTEKV
jgi:hypothetical protein